MIVRMKKYLFALSFLTIIVLAVSAAQAGDVTSSFSTGDTLTATQMTEIKGAVNDNDARIDALQVSGGDTLSGLSCTGGQVAKFDGTSWACAEDIDTDTNTDTDTLGSLSCASEQVAKWDGTSWVCGADDDSSVPYTGGAGIDVTGATISIPSGGVTATEIAADSINSSKIVDGSIVAADIDNTSVQQRLKTDCDNGFYLLGITNDGTPICGMDQDTDTTYSAGAGISISGTTINAEIGANHTIEPPFTIIILGNTNVHEVASVSITAPSAGFVIVTHSGVATFSGPDTIEVGIGLASTAFTTSMDINSIQPSTSDRPSLAYSTQYLFTVSAAGNKTYFGLAQNGASLSSRSILIIPQSMTAIFIPNKI